MANIGDKQPNGWLKIAQIESGGQGRSAIYHCVCTRQVDGATCGRKRMVRADHWRNERQTMCAACVGLEKQKPSAPAEGLSVSLQKRIARAFQKHLFHSVKAGVTLSLADQQGFITELIKHPELLDEYENDAPLHRDDLNFGGYPQYVSPTVAEAA